MTNQPVRPAEVEHAIEVMQNHMPGYYNAKEIIVDYIAKLEAAQPVQAEVLMMEDWDWLVGKSFYIGEVISVHDGCATMQDGDDEFRIRIGELLQTHHQSTKAAVDAAFIVRDCNVHEDLLQDLTEALVYVEDAVDAAGFKPGVVKKLANRIRANIAKAEGK